MNGSNMRGARVEYHAAKERELYKQYLQELRETGKIGARTEFPLNSPVTPEEFLERYSFRFKNFFRLIDLVINYATTAKYDATKFFMKEQENKSLEEKLGEK
jgi:hypothetical protein